MSTVHWILEPNLGRATLHLTRLPKRRRFWLGSGKGWRTRSERLSFMLNRPIARGSPLQRLRIISHPWQVEKVYSDFDKETAEIRWNGMKVTTWHLRWHLRCSAASSINNSPFASRGSGSLGSVLRWIYVAQPQLSGDAGSGSSCAPFGLEGRRLGDGGHHRTTWQGKTWDSDTSTDSFRIKIFSRSFQDLQAV